VEEEGAVGVLLDLDSWECVDRRDELFDVVDA
jgi:hypothetical protein